jgi:hypothetical protein
VGSGEEAGEDQAAAPVIVPSAYEVSLRKFVAYVLFPGHESGKDRIFINRLGFRAQNADDARYLADLYLGRARSAIAELDYELGGTDEFGVRCTIVVWVRGIAIRTGWLLRPSGTLELVTPFAGFARGPRKETP